MERDETASGAERPRVRRPRWLPRILVESVLIVASVLLALAVDEWSEQRDEREAAEVAVQSIRAELVENRRNVARARSNHLAMRDSLAAYVAMRQAPPARLYLAGIFNPGLVHSTAWESAREAGAMDQMPYDLVLALSRIYDRQGRYQDLADGLVQGIMADIRREGIEPVLREAGLLREYDRALGALQQHQVR